MEHFQELREIAKKKIIVADHMLTQTYPMVKEPKLLLAVLENIFLALANAMTSLLEYERLFKRIPAYQETFDSKLNIFRIRLVDKYKIDKKYVQMISDVKETILEHKKSPVEFARKDKLVICDDEYQMKSISLAGIKQNISDTKQFIDIIQKITSKNEDIFVKT